MGCYELRPVWTSRTTTHYDDDQQCAQIQLHDVLYKSTKPSCLGGISTTSAISSRVSYVSRSRSESTSGVEMDHRDLPARA